MALDDTLRVACDGLRSVRANERKKNAELLKDFLTRNAAPSLLSENTVRKRGYTWSDVFDDINEYILKETEKYETSKTFDTVTVPLCSTLLHLCVSGANKGQAYIKCEKITEACLNILKDSRLAKAIGDAYLNLLYKHVVPCEHYLGHITPSSWEELLDVAITACLSNNSKLDNFTKLRLVLLVVKNGKNNCQYVLPLRDSLSRLKKCFLKVASDKKVQEVVVEIVILLLETLSAECRLTMCHFSETTLSSILKFYDQNMDQKKKSLLFELLHGAVVLHHPRGRQQNEEGSLACDWAVWNKHVYSILEIICLEVSFLQKARKQNDNMLKMCPHYFSLAASVYFQIFKHTDTQENDPSTSSKRQKLSFNRNKTFSNLIDEFRQHHVPWMGVIYAFVKKYGHTICADDYISLTNVIGLLVTNNSSSLNWNIFENLSCLVLRNLMSNAVCRKNDDDNVLTSLWNSCVRNSTCVSATHKALHTIMQTLMASDLLKYENAQPLIKLYLEKGMPVTDSSVKTFSVLFNKFYNKCSHNELRLGCFAWLAHGEITSVDVTHIRELLLRLVANENLIYITECKTNPTRDTLYDTLFNSIEECILFSEFELEHPKTVAPSQEHSYEKLEINAELEHNVREYFTSKLTDYIERLHRKDVALLEFTRFLNISLAYLDIEIKYINRSTHERIEDGGIYCTLKRALTHMYLTLNAVLSSDAQIPVKIKLLQSVKDLMVTELDPVLSAEIRLCVNNDFFHCINNILNTKVKTDDDEILCEEDEEEMSINALKHHCIYVIAAFCRKLADYRDELLDLILDPKIYNFKSDVECALQCIELLNDSEVEQAPLGLLFTLMANMCRDLYRDSKASLGILKILIKMLDSIWKQGHTTKQNCTILVKSYLQRCEKMFYPPSVAALIYECGAKIATLNRRQNHDTDSIFEISLQEKMKGDIHSVRVYCCYLLKSIFHEFSEDDTKAFVTGLLDIFLIKVSEKRELVLKDESANRTLTVLHSLLALVQTKRSLIERIVFQILQFQKEKSLDKDLIKKVLNIIVNTINMKDIECYLEGNILSLLYFWFTRDNSIDDLPVYVLGCENIDMFVEKHKKWLVSAEILWRNAGNVRDSDAINRVRTTPEESVATVIEMCFSDIIALCLPYIVTEKYKHSYWGSEAPNAFKRSIANANKLFQNTGQILPSEKWTNLFVENVGELLLMTATHLCDRNDAERLLRVNIPEQTRSYYYPKNVFLAILDYIGELTDGNIMQYLCENQPMAIFEVLFQLWKNVINENVFEFRVLALHAYISFIESIPLGHPSDAFVCNFACKNFAHAIKERKTHEDLRIFVDALKTVLDRLLPEKVDLIRKSISQLLPILLIKKEEGFEKECAQLLNYLVVDMKDYLKESEDVIDFISSVSQGVVDDVLCATMSEFLDKLKTYKLSLVCPSYETLLKMRRFLKSNKHHLKVLYNNLDLKGFSEDCETSLIHQITYSLNNILQSASDDKTIIEACNCLSEIGSYDLKTLVTVPPADTQKVIRTNPKHYFIVAVVKALTEVLFDEDPAVTNKVAETLNSLLKHFEDNDILDLEELEKKILKPLSSVNIDAPLIIKVNIGALDKYCGDCKEGIFIKSMITNWVSNGSGNHCDWLKQVTSVLLNLIEGSTSCLETLQQVCSSKSNVCRSILPALTGLLLFYCTEKYVSIIGEHINKFFNYIWEQTFDDKVESSGDSHIATKAADSLDHGQKMVVQYMLDIVDFVRLQRNYYKTRPNRTIETLNYLRLEYDKVAWAATVADQNLAAVYYGELWAVAQNDGVPPSSPESTICLNGGDNVQQIFRKCYVSIGEMDAVDGCGTAHLTIEDEKRKHLINTGQYADALLLHDIALSCGAHTDHSLQCGVVRSLHKSGMHHLALQYIKSLPENDELNDIKYECLSFLGDWSEFVDTRQLEEKSKQATCNPNSILKAFHYTCLKDCLNIQTTHDFVNKMVVPLNRAKLAVSRLCQNINMENCQSVYKVVGKLHLFTDIEDYYAVRSETLSIRDLLNQWQIENLPSFNDFKHLEALISQRVLILEHAARSCNDLLKEILSLQIQYAQLGLSNNRVQMAQRVLALAKKLQSSEEVALVDSEISWAKGHKEIALSLLRNIVTNESPDVKMSGMSLRQYGLWMAESKRDNARDIINKYLLKSLAVLRKSDHVETRLKVYYDIAKFADAEYKQVVAYMNSSIFENKVKCLESMRGTASSLRSTQQPLTKDEKKALYVNDRFKEMDEAEIASTRVEKESFLRLAMRYYLLSLKQCEENNLSVFRVISLWLENPSFEFEDKENMKFSDVLHAIPSRKYVTVLPQLAPRLTNEKSDFADNLKKIIKRCAIEHPHHTLPILFSLKNSDKDKLIMNASSNTGGSTPRNRACEPRVAAAEALVMEISKADKGLAVIIAQMENVCDAMISFANYKPKTKDAKQKIPAAEMIHKLNNLGAVPVPTVTIPIRSDCRYLHLPTIQSFENYFELVGGINCPKKITCTDSSGRKRILLIKGEDDLRQDAVMQQVFNIVNALLKKNPVTSRKKLLIRTYKVVPMSRQSGVLEWCVGTMPLGLYLAGVGTSGAHARYRPQDISCTIARKKMTESYEARHSNTEKLLVFTRILREFKPVFHYFFTEHYLNPVTWYERRLAYTKSVATSSMVGYILGLGDRHVQNILIDKRTAEVVHIDFGIAFDQGKTLHTPETVPFRLTQDMIAGFGSSGVEGIFRNCCEKTMQLLRDNQETLLTILEVLLCDPLYSWTVTTAQQNNRSNRNASVNCNAGSNSGLAERALLTVSSKLSGTEGGVAGGVAVPGQVARLLQSAADPANLCRLFPGWQPYL